MHYAFISSSSPVNSSPSCFVEAKLELFMYN